MWKGEDYVFVSGRPQRMARGNPYHPSTFTNNFEKACRKAGLPRIALHDSRHTVATVGGRSGVVDLKTMQAMLGHADPKILIDTYTHYVSDAGREAAVSLENL